MLVADIALAILAVPVLVWTGYLACLACLSSANPVPTPFEPPRTRFDVIIPAHNEETGIAATVESLLSTDYPTEMRRVVVVADNCNDATAERARQAGAVVLERHDLDRRGKGYALEYAFERTIAEASADAVVVVDADTSVTPNLLRAFDARLGSGAEAVQAEYAVANRTESWRTRLMHLAFVLFHDVRSRARERLKVSAGLRGNGMAFSVGLLRAVPHDAYSLVEDVEYGIRIGLAGRRVHYAGDARVFGQMVASERGSRSQRRRWEGGRGKLVRQQVPRLLRQGLRGPNVLLLDLAADLLVPPLTYVALCALLGLLVSAMRAAVWGAPWWPVVPWLIAVSDLTLYVVRGAWLARVGARAILDLMWAPVYMTWKVLLALRAAPSSEREWIRTTRRGERPRG